MGMYETRVPERIERAKIVEALNVLGIDANSASRVCIEKNAVFVDAYLRGEDGNRRLCDGDLDKTGYAKVREVVPVVPAYHRAAVADVKAGAL